MEECWICNIKEDGECILHKQCDLYDPNNKCCKEEQNGKNNGIGS